ncbi:MAG: MBL fold metallo-hydrolase [Oscillospiraceae bacterium]|nr:MBL fold metallo-hydrolase [Oscillospiraceae bacterium]
MIMYKGLNMITCGMENCYIIRGEKGDVLIDTGSEKHRKEIGRWLQEFDPRLIILTHGHNDHIENAAYFADIYGIPIMISPYDLRLARDNKCREYYNLTPLGHILRRENKRCMERKVPQIDPKIFAIPDMDLSPYGIRGRIVNLEGHTKGSVGILCEGEMGVDLYAGDAVMNIFSPSLPMIAESPKKAITTAAYIAKLSPERILCGHGKPICKGQNEYSRFMNKFSNKIKGEM